MKLIKVLSLVICLSLIGCFPTRQLALTDMSTEVIELPFKVDSFKIIDKRENLLPMNWDVPGFKTKKKEWVGNPEISEVNRHDIEQIIRKSENPEGVPVTIEFNVMEGVCKLNADWKSVVEYANFKGEITLVIPSRNYTFKSYAEMYYENPSINGTEKGTMKLYNQAVKNVTHMMLKQISEKVKI